MEICNNDSISNICQQTDQGADCLSVDQCTSDTDTSSQSVWQNSLQQESCDQQNLASYGDCSQTCGMDTALLDYIATNYAGAPSEETASDVKAPSYEASSDVESSSEETVAADVEASSEETTAADVEAPSYEASSDVESSSEETAATDVETSSEETTAADVEAPSYEASSDVESSSEETAATDAEASSEETTAADVEAQSYEASSDVESSSEETAAADVEASSEGSSEETTKASETQSGSSEDTTTVSETSDISTSDTTSTDADLQDLPSLSEEPTVTELKQFVSDTYDLFPQFKEVYEETLGLTKEEALAFNYAVMSLESGGDGIWVMDLETNEGNSGHAWGPFQAAVTNYIGGGYDDSIMNETGLSIPTMESFKDPQVSTYAGMRRLAEGVVQSIKEFGSGQSAETYLLGSMANHNTGNASTASDSGWLESYGNEALRLMEGYLNGHMTDSKAFWTGEPF